MGCVIHEEIIRNKLRNQMQFPHVLNAGAPQPTISPVQQQQPMMSMPPPPPIQPPNKQMNREQFIEQMASAYALNTGAPSQANSSKDDWTD